MAERISLRDYQRDLAARLRAAGSGHTASKLAVQVGSDSWLVDLGLAVVPRLAQGRFSMEQLRSLIGTSQLCEGPMEGIYLRRDRGDWLEQRAKMVRAEFAEGIAKHWSEESLEKNSLANMSSQ